MYDIKLCHGSRRRINLVAENAERFSTTVDSTSCSSIASRNLATANSIVHRTCHVGTNRYLWRLPHSFPRTERLGYNFPFDLKPVLSLYGHVRNLRYLPELLKSSLSQEYA